MYQSTPGSCTTMPGMSPTQRFSTPSSGERKTGGFQSGTSWVRW